MTADELYNAEKDPGTQGLFLQQKQEMGLSI